MMQFLIQSCSLYILVNAFNMVSSPSAIFATVITFALQKVYEFKIQIKDASYGLKFHDV